MSMAGIGAAVAGAAVSSFLGSKLGKSADKASVQPTTTEKSENTVSTPWSGIIPYLIGDSPPPYWLTQTPQATDAWLKWGQDVGRGGLSAPPQLRVEDVYPKPPEPPPQEQKEQPQQPQQPQNYTPDIRNLYKIFAAQSDWDRRRQESWDVSPLNSMLGLFNPAFSPISKYERQQRLSSRLPWAEDRPQTDWTSILSRLGG